MATPRGKYVPDGEEGIYHCYTRCVRRAALCGYDPVTSRDFSHRKAWVVDRLRFLASIFAIDVCAYSVMETHVHNILWTRPDRAVTWSDREVATRWLRLFPKKTKISLELQISALTDCPKLIAELRRRLCSLSWFMAQLNEFIARAANKEDGVKGHFWESRFKCKPLLDDAAVISCMVYVDLNLVRAGRANTPEESDFTSIQERIREWAKANMAQASASGDPSNSSLGDSSNIPISLSQEESDSSICFPKHTKAEPPETTAAEWLCPIHSTLERRGILPMTALEYFDLVDRSGRILRTDKCGAIDPDLAPILLRIGVKPAAWPDTISHFESRFGLAVGFLSSLRRFADQIGNHWISGISSARKAFALSPP